MKCTLIAPLILLLSCTRVGTEPAPPRATPVEASRDPAALVPSGVLATVPAEPTPERSPPPAVTTPMDGEPDAVALSEARLETSSCTRSEELMRDRVTALIRQMRAEVDESFESWRQAQPDCWEEYRQRGLEVGESWGLGGTVGLGQGYGAGHGRLSGSHAARAPSVRMGAAKAKSASGTNTQVAGVDEADIVKNDGRYVYVALNGALFIYEALRPRLLSRTPLAGEVREMFVEGDRAVVYTSQGGNGRRRCTYGYDCVFAGDGSSTKIVVLDVSDRSAPRRMRELELSGSLIAARRIGNAVHTVVSDGDAAPPAYATWPDGLETCGTLEKAVRERFQQLKRRNEQAIRSSFKLKFPTLKERGKEKALCDPLYKTRIADGEAFTTVVSFDMMKDLVAPRSVTLQSRPGAVFASSTALYVSVVHRGAASRRWYSFYPVYDEVSDVHKFGIGEDPSATKYVGSGVVPGHVLNQFAMDEWYGYLRIATTRGRVPDPKVESMISILADGHNGVLVRVGAIEKIAPGEDIRAVRFDDDRGYVVTFKKTDPLFVVDLYEPARPRILGELKIPGFSTYMHRIDRDHLLSIGFDADDRGSFAYFDGVILQLFDVKQPTEPKLIHKEKIGTRGSSSEAATNHLAFNYFAEKGLLAVPMTICEGGGDGRNGHALAFSGLLVYSVSVDKGFAKLGGIDHGTRGANCGTWWSNANSQVKRSVFLDDLVYSLASDRMKVQRLGAFGTDVADFPLVEP